MTRFPTTTWRCASIALLGMICLNASAQTLDISDHFVNLFSGNEEVIRQSLNAIEAEWEPGLEPMVLETFRLTRDPLVAHRLVRTLRNGTHQDFGFDVQAWQEWLWNRPEQRHPKYAAFKSKLYGLIDMRFRDYFNDDAAARIRLDEVVWGGVRQDGIPPLRGPDMIAAGEADYLDDDNVVFGISINGDNRAYPKRILAWHEMFVDTVGGTPVAGVYCTLCGTVILYKTEHQGTQHKLGTSGFLYRSNKLMYDQQTQSLWNTLWGEPVIGPLAEEGIKLDYLSVVTTTWGEWRRRHPDTQVLSLRTGHTRDYGEGVAYHDYFATDELMFNVPKTDPRLLNKQEIFAVILSQHPEAPLAISADYLRDNPVYHDQINGTRFVVLTDPSGANRLYQAGEVQFTGWDGDTKLSDQSHGMWMVSEDVLESSDGEKLFRLPAYRAFWFGWYSAYPHTRLVR